MVSVWDYLILRAKVRVAIVCSIIFDDHQQEKGASPFSVRNRSFWIDGISVFPPRMDGGHFGKYLSMMENRTQGNHFGLADVFLQNVLKFRFCTCHHQ